MCKEASCSLVGQGEISAKVSHLSTSDPSHAYKHTSVAKEVMMLFSRTGGHEFKPTRGNLFKGFGNLDFEPPNFFIIKLTLLGL